MAPLGKLRKVLGVVKDQTSIGLAMVTSSRAPDLDVAIVKATSHDDMPTDEKHVQEILYQMSCYRGCVSVCVAGLAKRLNKTHNWIVAIKTLMVTHRLLRDGEFAFEDELLLVSRRSLNVCNFRDDSETNGWDYSAFVRTYGMYINEGLDCFASFSALSDWNNSRDGYRSSYEDRRSDCENYASDDYGRRSSPKKKQNHMMVKDMTLDMLLDKLPSLQGLLERVLACRPTGGAKHHRLVQIALSSIVKESFQIYSDLCDGMTILLDKFYDMGHQDSIKTFEIYARFGKQAENLSSFYSGNRSSGICRPSEYPSVQKISHDQLEDLEAYLSDRSRASLPTEKPRSPEPVAKATPTETDSANESEDVQELTTIKALPAFTVPDVVGEQKPAINGDLISLSRETISAEEHGNELALALFTSESTTKSGNWEMFGSSTHQGEQTKETSSLWHTTSENGKAGWELALVAEASNLSKAGGSMAGGFNRLLLDSMYDQATTSRTNASTVPSGSASSVTLPGKPPSSILALPAPVLVAGEDPFSASVNVPPPSYVQMADLRQKQQLLVHEHQLWQQYQRAGMQGTYGITKFYNNYPYFVPHRSDFSSNGMFGYPHPQSGYVQY